MLRTAYMIKICHILCTILVLATVETWKRVWEKKVFLTFSNWLPGAPSTWPGILSTWLPGLSSTWFWPAFKFSCGLSICPVFVIFMLPRATRTLYSTTKIQLITNTGASTREGRILIWKEIRISPKLVSIFWFRRTSWFFMACKYLIMTTTARFTIFCTPQFFLFCKCQ